MLIIDTRQSISLNTSRLDWNPERIKFLDNDIIAIPIHDPALDKTVEVFAYDVAARQPWAYPDMTKTTVFLQADASRSFYRFSLLIGVKPDEHFNSDYGPEWAEFEATRKKAVEINAGKAVYDSFPTMLNPNEDDTIRALLYEKLDIY